MADDYLPKSLPNLKPWLENLKTRIAGDAPTLGRSPAQVTADLALVESMLTPVSDALTQQSASVQADGTARTAMSNHDSALREMLNQYKAAPGWNEGLAESWKAKTHTPTYDMNTHKPTITAHAQIGTVEIRGKKPGFSAVSIQMRLDGTTEWTTIGVKISHFPFHDTTAPQTPGKPEKREYRALGYSGDQQSGQPSDTITAIYS